MDESLLRSKLLDTAKEIITGPRAATYGDAYTNFSTIADLWTTYINRRGMGVLAPEDVALMLALVKVARLAGQPTHWDSWLDLAGYAALGGEVAERRTTKQAGVAGSYTVKARQD